MVYKSIPKNKSSHIELLKDQLKCIPMKVRNNPRTNEEIESKDQLVRRPLWS